MTTSGGAGANVTAIGGDNNGTIIHSAAPAGDRLAHVFHPVDRWRTPVTSGLVLMLNLIMTVCSISSVVLGVIQTITLFKTNGLAATSGDVPVAVWFILGGVFFLVLSPSGWAFWSWLKKHLYHERIIFGRVPESRADEKGRDRLFLTRLRGTCAIDGAEMRPRRRPAPHATRYESEIFKVPKYSHYELQLWCQRLRSDPAHRARVDLSEVESQ
jgi:hypothetical protein